jgi:hypothetical protein
MCSDDLKPYKLEILTCPALDIPVIYDDVYRIWQTFFLLFSFFILFAQLKQGEMHEETRI